MSRYILFWAKLKRRGKPFLKDARTGAALWDFPLEHWVLIKDEKVCPFVKFEIILFLLCCLLGLLTNNHCRASWGPMIDLRIDSRTCQKYRILLLARQRCNNYLELSKVNLLGNTMLPHWLCFTSDEHWRKPPIFTAFLEISLYLKNNDSLEQVWKVLLIVLFIYFKGKIKFTHCIWSSVIQVPGVNFPNHSDQAKPF